jgi:ubiquinone/menaquinone biosynthesis C-methylase UbiE
VTAKLERGANVADVGCGHGVSTLLMADAFPNSEFVGIDYHEGSIAHAREKANGRKNVRFEVARAQDFAGARYDLVTMFDSLHDMGDPVGAVAHIRDVLAEDGTLMLIAPARPTSACRRRSIRTSDSRSAPKPAQSASARSCAKAASPISARRRRRRST